MNLFFKKIFSEAD